MLNKANIPSYRPRVILLEHRGKLVGLVTVKDVLKYIVYMENNRSPYQAPESQTLSGIMEWVAQRSARFSGAYRRVNSRPSEEEELELSHR